MRRISEVMGLTAPAAASDVYPSPQNHLAFASETACLRQYSDRP